MSTVGTDLLNKIASGEIGTRRNAVTHKVRQEVSAVFDEIIEIGARIRPILYQGSRVGWVRGLSVGERKLLSNWTMSQTEMVIEALVLATTFTREEIMNMNYRQFRSLINVSRVMSDADVSLYPYIIAYTSTSQSEVLWRSGGTKLTQFHNKEVTMFDGKTIKIMCPSDHSRFWASVCSKRDENIFNLNRGMDAAMVTSVFSKGAGKVSNNLMKELKKYDLNSDEPWKTIQVEDLSSDIDLNDGWGHAHEDFSEEGLLREGAGMVEFDKHEQFMEKFYQTYMYKQPSVSQDIVEPGIEESVQILTDKQIRELSKKQDEQQKIMDDKIRRESDDESQYHYIVE